MTRTLVVGAGPVGLFSAMALARGGEDVTVVESDLPSSRDTAWRRQGVMQFELPHFFRPIVRQHLLGTLPEVWDAIISSGGIPARPDGLPEEMTGLHCRRSTFERAFWSVADKEAKLTWVRGRATRLVLRGDRVDGVVVNGADINADRVIVACGRASHFADTYRGPGEGGSCGFSYAARMYRARSGVSAPDSGFPIAGTYDGYQAIVFPQDNATLSALIVRPTSDTRLAALRQNQHFESAAAEIPVLAPWTDPVRFEPITNAMAGSGLSNTYRGQLDENGQAAVAGLFFVGDSVCTTNPAAGRGVSLGLRQAAELVRVLLGDHEDDRSAAIHFDSWSTKEIRPWYQDHVYWDATLLARFAGGDLDIEAAIPSDVICAAAEFDPSIRPVVGAFMAMMALPDSLMAVEEKARTLMRGGWRPAYAEGPSSDQIAELLHP